MVQVIISIYLTGVLLSTLSYLHFVIKFKKSNDIGQILFGFVIIFLIWWTRYLGYISDVIFNTSFFYNDNFIPPNTDENKE